MKHLILVIVLIVLCVEWLPCQSWTPSIPNRAVYSVCADPQNPLVLYAGNVARTVFKSTDGGIIWEERAIGTQGGTSVVQLVAVHPKKSNIVFAAGQGMSGLARSTDGGATWNTVLDTPDGFRCEFGGTDAVAFDPAHPDTIYAVRFAYGDVFRSADGGTNWELLSKLPGIESSDNMRTVTVCPDSSNVVIISGRRSNIYRSVDYGKTWSVLPALSAHRDADVASFAWSPSVKGTLYATVQMTLFYNTNNAGLYKSTDYGVTWKKIALTDTSVAALLVNPTKNGDELLVGGCQFLYPADNGTIRGDSLVFRSVTGTDTMFTQISDVPWTQNESGMIGYNAYEFAVTQRNGYPVVLLASDGGLFSSDNLTSVYEQETIAPLQTIRFAQDRFQIPESLKGACHYVVSDISGRTLLSGFAPAAAWVQAAVTPQPVYVTISDGQHIVHGLMMP